MVTRLLYRKNATYFPGFDLNVREGWNTRTDASNFVGEDYPRSKSDEILLGILLIKHTHDTSRQQAYNPENVKAFSY